MEPLFDCDSLTQEEREHITGLLELKPTRPSKLLVFSTPYSKDNHFRRLFDEWQRRQEESSSGRTG